jgi:hypothetical protein
LIKSDAYFRPYLELLSGAVHCSVDSRHANYQFQFTRGKRSLTNQFLIEQHPGHHPQARLVVFDFLS